jgi:hypothetical protein
MMTHNVMRPNRRPNIFWKPSIERLLRFNILVKSCALGLMVQSMKPIDFGNHRSNIFSNSTFLRTHNVMRVDRRLNQRRLEMRFSGR